MDFKEIFKYTSSSWVRYDRYEYKKGADGEYYITPAMSAKLTIYDPLKVREQLIIDTLNVGLLMMKREKKKIVQAAVLDLVTKYGLFGFMTALPTTPEFITYHNVYLHINHFIKEEIMETEDYLDIFFPFEKLKNFVKNGRESRWDIENDIEAVALSMTMSSTGGVPDAVEMVFQRQYAERYDWICKHLKDLAFSFLTPTFYYKDYDKLDETTRHLYRKGMAAFGGISPTYRIILDERPVLVWNFYSLMSCIQMIFSYMITDETHPIKPCKNCEKAFVPSRPNAVFCSRDCNYKYDYDKDKK